MIRTDKFKMRVINDVAFLIAIKKNKFGFSLFSLNKLGAFIWCELEHEILIGDLYKRVQDQFPTTKKEDVNMFIQNLIKLELIERDSNVL